MSHRVISIFLFVALAGTAAVFSRRPPRAQAHLASLERLLDAALAGLPTNSRLYLRTDANVTERHVWCRYFAAPRIVLRSPGNVGDTVLWLHRESQALPPPATSVILSWQQTGGLVAAVLVLR